MIATRVEGEIARALAERLPTYHIKYRFRRADGAVRWLEGFARLRTNERGEPISLLGVSHDVTEREELLEGEQQARRDAEAANAAKAIFLTTMSHELRTPLNAVSGYVDLLEMGVRGPTTEAQREDLRRIRRASQHLLSLINDILNYARLEAGSVELHVSDIILADALAGMEALIAPQLRAKGVVYEYQPCDRSLRVQADREKLDQILLNLVGNAVKFTERDGRITLSCEHRRGTCARHRPRYGARHPARKAAVDLRPVRAGRSTSHARAAAGSGTGAGDQPRPRARDAR